MPPVTDKKGLSPYQGIFIFLALFLAILMPGLSTDYGMTFDEWQNANNALFSLRNTLTLGHDVTYLSHEHFYLYSHLFYTIVTLVYGALGGPFWSTIFEGFGGASEIIKFFNIAHVINALFGYVAILFAGLTASRIAGWRAGSLALLFMALSPRFLGSAMNNPKDIPFAAGYALTTYFACRFLEALPGVCKRSTLFLALGFGVLLGTRIAGVIFLAYILPVLFFVLWHEQKRSSNKLSIWIKPVSFLFSAVLAGYLLALLVWPYGRLNPILNPIRASLELAAFTGWDNEVLFEGVRTKASELPWYYLPKWILISTPFFLHLALIPAVLFYRDILKIKHLRNLVLIVLSVFLPLTLAIVKGSVVYDSWRHFLFIYPGLMILCAISWEFLLRHFKNFKKGFWVFLCLSIFLIEPFLWMIKYHPHTYTYFNILVGGLSGAHGRYETDYWGNALQEASRALVNFHKSKVSPEARAFVRADGHVMQTYPILKNELGDFYRPFQYPENFLNINPFLYVSYAPLLGGNAVWNYALVLSRYWPSEMIRQGKWPPPNTLYEVKAGEVTLAAVVINPESPLWGKRA